MIKLTDVIEVREAGGNSAAIWNNESELCL